MYWGIFPYLLFFFLLFTNQMQCPKCKTPLKRGKKKVISVEHIHNFTIRYCKCLNCSYRYKTYESMSKEDLRVAIS